LFVAPGEGEALVLRAATGELLDKRQLAPFEKRMTTIGRNVLSWEPQGAKFALEMRDPWENKTLWSISVAAGAKAAFAAQDAVGVFEPEGSFTLVKLPEGKVLVKETLEPEKGLTGIHLLRSSEAYLLITNSAARNGRAVNVQPLPNSGNSPFVNGHVYAFGLERGEKLWPAPATIENFGMFPTQPSALPLLVFAHQVSRRTGPSTGREARMAILCIDKRTGQAVYESDTLMLPTFGVNELACDPAKQTVTMTFGPSMVELKLTDEPRDAEKKPEEAAEKSTSLGPPKVIAQWVKIPPGRIGVPAQAPRAGK
jgi:hypothetical protein